MSVSVSTVLSRFGGSHLEYGVPASMRIDEVTRLTEFVVIGNPRFASLVVCTREQLTSLMRSATEQRIELLRQAVLVTEAESDELHDFARRERLSMIVGATPPDDGLQQALALVVATNAAAADRKVAAGTQVLTQVARRGGVTGVIAELAHRIDGWAVLLDAHGQLIDSAGAGRLHLEDAVAVALSKPVRVRHESLQVHPVGSEGDLTGYLIVSSRTSGTSSIRDLASQAAALFDLILRTHDPSMTEHLGRQVMIELLAEGGERAVRVLRRWGVLESELCGFVLTAPSKQIDTELLAARWLDQLGSTHLFSRYPAGVRGFVRADHSDELVKMAQDSTIMHSAGVGLGIGRAAPVASLSRTLDQAEQACDAAVRSGARAMTFDALSTVRHVLDGLDGPQSSSLHLLLDPLRDDAGHHGELTRTLRVFLAEHGSWRPASRELGIHRQTLMNRIARVEELTGLSFSVPDDRAAAWLALRALHAP